MESVMMTRSSIGWVILTVHFGIQSGDRGDVDHANGTDGTGLQVRPKGKPRTILVRMGLLLNQFMLMFLPERSMIVQPACAIRCLAGN